METPEKLGGLVRPQIARGVSFRKQGGRHANADVAGYSRRCFFRNSFQVIEKMANKSFDICRSQV
jgi:hypothetical protein